MVSAKKNAIPTRAITRTASRTQRLPGNYVTLLTEPKGRVRSAQVKAAISVNRELIALYLHIGRRLAEQEAGEWGERVVEKLAKDFPRGVPFHERFLSDEPLLHAASPSHVGRRREIGPTACWTIALGAPPRSRREGDGHLYPRMVREPGCRARVVAKE